MKQDEIAWALMDIKAELEIYKTSKDEQLLDQAIKKIDSLGNELDFKGILNSIKRMTYNKMQESTGSEREHYYKQYQLLKGATTLTEVYQIIS